MFLSTSKVAIAIAAFLGNCWISSARRIESSSGGYSSSLRQTRKLFALPVADDLLKDSKTREKDVIGNLQHDFQPADGDKVRGSKVPGQTDQESDSNLPTFKGFQIKESTAMDTPKFDFQKGFKVKEPAENKTTAPKMSAPPKMSASPKKSAPPRMTAPPKDKKVATKQPLKLKDRTPDETSKVKDKTGKEKIQDKGKETSQPSGPSGQSAPTGSKWPSYGGSKAPSFRPSLQPSTAKKQGTQGLDGQADGAIDVGPAGTLNETNRVFSLMLQAAFKYNLTARTKPSTDDVSKLISATQVMFTALFEEEYPNSTLFTHVFLQQTLSPRVFQFDVTPDFKNESLLPHQSDVEGTLKRLLARDGPFTLKYVEILQGLTSTIFDTTTSVEYLSDKDAIGKAIADANSDNSQGVKSKLSLLAIILIVIAAAVMKLTCLAYWCFHRRRKTHRDFSENYEVNLHDVGKYPQKTPKSTYRTSFFSKDGVHKAHSDLSLAALEPYAVDDVLDPVEAPTVLEDISLGEEESGQYKPLRDGEKIFRHSEGKKMEGGRTSSDPFNYSNQSNPFIDDRNQSNPFIDDRKTFDTESTAKGQQPKLEHGAKQSSFEKPTGDLVVDDIPNERSPMLSGAGDVHVTEDEYDDLNDLPCVQERLAEIEAKISQHSIDETSGAGKSSGGKQASLSNSPVPEYVGLAVRIMTDNTHNHTFPYARISSEDLSSRSGSASSHYSSNRGSMTKQGMPLSEHKAYPQPGMAQSATQRPLSPRLTSTRSASPVGKIQKSQEQNPLSPRSTSARPESPVGKLQKTKLSMFESLEPVGSTDETSQSQSQSWMSPKPKPVSVSPVFMIARPESPVGKLQKTQLSMFESLELVGSMDEANQSQSQSWTSPKPKPVADSPVLMKARPESPVGKLQKTKLAKFESLELVGSVDDASQSQSQSWMSQKLKPTPLSPRSASARPVSPIGKLQKVQLSSSDLAPILATENVRKSPHLPKTPSPRRGLISPVSSFKKPPFSPKLASPKPEITLPAVQIPQNSIPDWKPSKLRNAAVPAVVPKAAAIAMPTSPTSRSAWIQVASKKESAPASPTRTHAWVVPKKGAMPLDSPKASPAAVDVSKNVSSPSWIEKVPRQSGSPPRAWTEKVPKKVTVPPPLPRVETDAPSIAESSVVPEWMLKLQEMRSKNQE